MKKLLLYILFVVTSSLAAKAQYTDLFDFSGNNGINPYGALIYEGTYLYGTTANGGIDSLGVIFRIKADGTGDTVLHNFIRAKGTEPEGSLFTDSIYLYGMTFGGGANGKGTVFKIKPDGTAFTDLHDFTGIDGQAPYASFVSDGTYLYGTTDGGGTSGEGVVFRIKPDGTGDSVLHNFSGPDGHAPEGNLLFNGGYLYGTTAIGGAKDSGVIFRIKPDGTGDTILLNFASAKGAWPRASLISDGKYLYGTTQIGGKYVYGGVVFRIKLDGNGDTVLHSFASSPTDSGNHPICTLVDNGTYIYGIAATAGPTNNGTIFKIKPDGTEYTDLHNFSGTDGTKPLGSLITTDGIHFYGMTQEGGDSNYGVIFSYTDTTIKTGINELPVITSEVKVYPNPSDGVFILEQSAEKQKEEIEVYNVLGQKIFQHSFSALRTTLDLSGQPAGIYFYRIISEKGEAIGSGKLVIQ